MADSRPAKSLAIPLAAFAVGAVVALLVGVFGKVHDPTLAGTTTFGFRTVIDMKVVLSVVIGVLALLQLVGALWLYGRLGIGAPSWLGTAHRICGAVAVVHGILGCAVIGAVVVKIVAVRSRRAPGWFLPVAGGLLFALLIGAVLTSAIWYIAARGWPGSGGYG